MVKNFKPVINIECIGLYQFDVSNKLKHVIKNYTGKMKHFLLILCIGGFSCTKKIIQTATIPNCIQQKIETFKSQSKGNPPQSIIQYIYHKKRVFYIPPQCCDQYSEVYDDNCNLIGHPGGGITGRGDGNPVNFFKDATDSVTIWNDDR